MSASQWGGASQRCSWVGGGRVGSGWRCCNACPEIHGLQDHGHEVPADVNV